MISRSHASAFYICREYVSNGIVDIGYLDVGVSRNMESLNIKYIVPVKDNPEVLKFTNGNAYSYP